MIKKQPAVKISEQVESISKPGTAQVGAISKAQN